MQGRPIMSRGIHAEWLIVFGVLVCGAPVSDAYPNAVQAPTPDLAVDSPRIDQPLGLESDSQHFAPPAANVVTASVGDPSQARVVISSEPFGLPSSPAPAGGFSAKWAELQSRLDAEQNVIAGCRSGQGDCPSAARKFLHIVEAGQHRQGRAQLGEINRAINLTIRPVSDLSQYGLDDYWASPLATLSSGGGDCEDYAIAKYVALQEAGVTPEDLRLVIVRDLRRQAIHAVVAVHRDGEWLLLDNRTLVMLDADEARDYYPLFVLDHRGVRAF
jgi:predicted transglutaminase-like cysteine proteinase